MNHALEITDLTKRFGDKVAVDSLGGLLAYLVLISGALGGGHVLAWESTRIFPLRLRALFVAELVAGLGSLASVTFTLLTTFLLLGLGIANPRVFPLLPLPWLGTVGAIVSVRLLVTSLKARVIKHARPALVVSALLGGIGFVLKLDSKTHLVPPRAATLLEILDAMPSTQSIRGVAEAIDGRWVAALVRQAYPAAALFLLLLATAHVLKREADLEALRSAPKGGNQRLWTFSSRSQGVANLHCRTLLRSHFGRACLVLPFIISFASLGLIRKLPPNSGFWVVPAAFALLSISSIGLQLNQFGLDGPGVKALLLLPIPSRDLLEGKALGLAIYGSVQAVVFLAMMTLSGLVSPSRAVSGLCLSGCLFTFLAAVGHWISAGVPWRLPMFGLSRTRAPAMWIVLAWPTVALGVLVFGGTYVAAARMSPRAPWCVMAPLLALSVLSYRRVILPKAARYLDGRKEVLMKALA